MARRPSNIGAAISRFRARRSPMEELDKAWAAEREIELITARKIQHRKRNLSNKTRGFSRRDPLMDYQISQEIKDSLASHTSVRLVGRSGRGVLHRRTLLTYDARQQIINDIKKDDRLARKHYFHNLRTYWLPNWSHTGTGLKAFAWAMALHENGGTAFSLNLGDEVIGEAKRSGEFMTYIRDRFQRMLKSHFQKAGMKVPEYLFSVHATELKDPHLHGAVTVDEDDEDAKALLRQVLYSVGGEWKPLRGFHNPRQVHTRSLSTPVRWVFYGMKYHLQGELALGAEPLVASNGLRKLGKVWYCNAQRNGIILDQHEVWESDTPRVVEPIFWDSGRDFEVVSVNGDTVPRSPLKPLKTRKNPKKAAKARGRSSSRATGPITRPRKLSAAGKAA